MSDKNRSRETVDAEFQHASRESRLWSGRASQLQSELDQFDASGEVNPQLVDDSLKRSNARRQRNPIKN